MGKKKIVDTLKREILSDRVGILDRPVEASGMQRAQLAALAPFDYAQGEQDDYPRRIVVWRTMLALTLQGILAYN